MYKFTNGIVVYDEATKDRYIKAGMTLVEEEKVVKKEEAFGKNNLQNEVKRNEFERTDKRPTKFNRRYK